MPTIYLVENHHEVLKVWRRSPGISRRVLHLDYHCDLRGLLIHRKAQRAYRIRDRYPELGQGNFLAHAVLEGLVERIRWVHDDPGGRMYDLQTVKYENDLTALVPRIQLALRRDPGLALDYEVLKYKDWDQPRAGELVDLDWDFFACRDYPIETVANRVEKFLDRDFPVTPEHVFVCYSPEYSHPTRKTFEAFADRLADKFESDLVDLRQPCSQPDAVEKFRPLPQRLLRQSWQATCLKLRRFGIC